MTKATKTAKQIYRSYLVPLSDDNILMFLTKISMPKICGIDLDKTEARFVILDGNAQEFSLVETEITRLALADYRDQSKVREFHQRLQTFFEDNGIEMIGIRERLAKGRMKGGTITFKLEGLIQMCRQDVILISPATIRKAITNASIDLTELPIAKYQHEAYGAAYCLLNM